MSDKYRYTKVALILLLLAGFILALIYGLSMIDKCTFDDDCNKDGLKPYCNHTKGKCERAPDDLPPNCEPICKPNETCVGTECIPN